MSGTGAAARNPQVDVFSWNPRRRVFDGRFGRRLPIERPVNNFGDLLGPLVVDAMLARSGLERAPARRAAQLLSVGSVLHFAAEGAVVWGSGLNGKMLDHPLPSALDIRAVRGPRTRELLVAQGHDVPEVFGDPGLLVPMARPALRSVARTTSHLIVNNFHDRVPLRRRRNAISPRAPLDECLDAIASAAFVVGSSLHGIVVAEALGIPARAVRSATEPSFKYDDYYSGTGRPDWRAAASIDEALRLGGERPPEWSPEPLMNAFPADLWSGERADAPSRTSR